MTCINLNKNAYCLKLSMQGHGAGPSPGLKYDFKALVLASPPAESIASLKNIIKLIIKCSIWILWLAG